jgi:MGT family glycosyltransferase
VATIAAVHIGLGGHLGPLGRLGAALARQGHEVIAWAPESRRGQVEVDGVRLEPHEPMPREDIYGGLPGFTANLSQATDRCAGELIEQMFERRVDLVVHDCHAPWGLVAAEFLGLPRIASDPLFPIVDARAAALSGEEAAAASQDASGNGLRPLGAGANFYPGGLTAAVAAVESNRLAIVRRWGVDLGGWRDVMRCSAPAVASYTTEEILGAWAPRSGWWCLGPLMKPVPTSPAKRARPLVYVAMGTFFNYAREVFLTAIEALADEPVDVIVSTGRGYVSPADLEPLPDNVVVHEFVDSREVLAVADAHVTHGGGSSVHESLMAGVPMVCIPLGSDQFIWSRRVAELGAGQVVSTTPAAIRDGVRHVLEDKASRRRAEEVGRRLAEFDGESRLAGLVAGLLGQAVGARGVSSSSARGRPSRPMATGTS